MWSDRESELDLLNVQHLVAAVEATVRTDHLLPVTVGVFGDWGSGKSTVMNLAREALEKDADVLCVHFNGWLFEGYEDAKAAVLGTILDRLSEKEGLGEEAKRAIGRLIRRVNWFRLASAVGSAAMTAQGLPPEATVFAAGLQTAPKLKELVEEPPEGEDDVGRTIRDFEKDFRRLLKTTGTRSVVVFIDDLDRCLPTTIMSTLEAIRLFVFVPGMAFVIAADERLVRRAVRQHFPDVITTDTEVQANYPSIDLGREYLEKLIQVPVHVPPLSRAEIATYVNLLFAQLHLGDDFPACCDKVRKEMAASVGTEVVFSLPTAEKFLGGEPGEALAEDLSLAAQVGDILSASVHGNPRQTKRFLNTLLLRLKMAEARGVDVDRRLAAKLLLLEYFKPKLFHALGAWQAAQGGEPDQIRRLEAWHTQQAGPVAARAVKLRSDADEGNAREGDRSSDDEGRTKKEKKRTEIRLSEDLQPWVAEQWVRDWLALEPPLAGTGLTPYFFFARERTIGQLVAQLSSAARNVLQKLVVPSEVSHHVAIREAEELSPAEADGVFDSLVRHTSTVGGMERPNSALAGLLRFVQARPELQDQLAAYVGRLPASSIGGWVPSLLAAALTDQDQEAARDAIFTRWKSDTGLLKRATEMTEKTLKAAG